MVPSSMTPKKKPGAVAHPSTSRAPSHVAPDAAGATGTHEDVDAAGDVVAIGGVVTTSPTTEAGAGGTGEG